MTGIGIDLLGELAHAESDSPAAVAAKLDRASQVLALTHALDAAQRGRRSEQGDARVPEPERLERCKLLDELERDLGRREHRIDVPLHRRRAPSELTLGVLGKGGREGRDLLRVHREARGCLVAPEAQQVMAARGDAGVQVVARDASPRALALTLADGDEHHRPAVLLHQPRCHDADHALVPVPRCDHVGVPIAPFGRRDVHQGDRLLQDGVLHRLPVAIEVLELGGELAGAALVGGEHQLERLAGMAQPARGVDARGQPEADVRCRDVHAVDPRREHQRAQADLLRAGEPPQAVAHQAPVLVAQRHDVGHGGNRDQIEVLLELGRVAPGGSVERSRELVGDGRAAQLGKRVVRGPRAHPQRVGELRAGLVVVGDDDVHAELPGPGDLRDRGDAAIDGDQEADTGLRKLLDRGGGETVALLEPAGQVPLDVRAEALQREHRHGRGTDAVGVVVAVDADAGLLRDRLEDAAARRGHVAERQRIVAGIGGREECLGQLGRVVAPPDESLGSDAMHAELRREIVGGGRCARGEDPPRFNCVHGPMLGSHPDVRAARGAGSR